MKVRPVTVPLKGTTRVPGDKSVTHRAVMFASIAEGTSTIRGGGRGEDNYSTMAVMRQLGASVTEQPDGTVVVEGVGLRGLHEPSEPLDCGNSGTTARLLVGLLAGAGIEATLTGDASLSVRPMARVADPLRDLGYKVETSGERHTLPMRTSRQPRMADDEPVRANLKVASAQVKSCILLSGLYRSTMTQVVEPAASRDHTERLLRAMGLRVESSPHYMDPVAGAKLETVPTTILHPGARLRAGTFDVPGDISSAAFLIVAGLLFGERVVIENVGINPTRVGMLSVLERMGASLQLENRRVLTTGEPVADIVVQKGTLKGTVIEGAEIPLLIDEIPVLCVLGAACEGELEVRDAAELRVKESDRVATTAAILRAMQVDIEEREDGMVVRGIGRTGWSAFRVDAALDHRIGMAAAIAALGADGECEIEGAEAIAVSYPDFSETLRGFGADLDDPGAEG